MRRWWQCCPDSKRTHRGCGRRFVGERSLSRTPFAINSTTNSREVSWAKPVSQVHGDSCTPHLQGRIPSAVRLGIVARGEKGRVRRTMPINDSKMPRPWRRNHETRQTQLRPHYSTHLARPKAALHGSGEHAKRYFVHKTEHRSSESTNTVQGCHTSPPPGMKAVYNNCLLPFLRPQQAYAGPGAP